MTAPDPYAPTGTPPASPPASAATVSPLFRIAIWVAIGALIAAAIVCVVWVLIGEQNGLIGRAFLTILLLAAFAAVAILDAHLAPSRPGWFALASMATWVVTLLIGAVMIWMPERYSWFGFNRFLQFLLIVLILQLMLLHVRLYYRAYQRHTTPFSQTVYIVTIALVVALAAMLVVPLIVAEYVEFADIYWRIVVAVTILAAVGTALLPLTNALFAPKKPRAQRLAPPPVAQAPVAQQWPTYADAMTPLPVMPDGSPDWNAYYTGHPTNQLPQSAMAQPSEPQPTWQPAPPTGYEGYPPPPPLPPRS